MAKRGWRAATAILGPHLFDLIKRELLSIARSIAEKSRWFANFGKFGWELFWGNLIGRFISILLVIGSTLDFSFVVVMLEQVLSSLLKKAFVISTYILNKHFQSKFLGFITTLFIQVNLNASSWFFFSSKGYFKNSNDKKKNTSNICKPCLNLWELC